MLNVYFYFFLFIYFIVKSAPRPFFVFGNTGCNYILAALLSLIVHKYSIVFTDHRDSNWSLFYEQYT